MHLSAKIFDSPDSSSGQRDGFFHSWLYLWGVSKPAIGKLALASDSASVSRDHVERSSWRPHHELYLFSVNSLTVFCIQSASSVHPQWAAASSKSIPQVPNLRFAVALWTDGKRLHIPTGAVKHTQWAELLLLCLFLWVAFLSYSVQLSEVAAMRNYWEPPGPLVLVRGETRSAMDSSLTGWTPALSTAFTVGLVLSITAGTEI